MSNLTGMDLSQHELVSPELSGVQTTSTKILNGKNIPPKQQILLFSADDWEDFIEEWGHYQKSIYHLVCKLGGANDHGIDVACFRSKNGFLGEWDNFQCKYYNKPLTSGVAIPEIGKILWHVYSGNITKPQNYYFFAPKDCGPSLKKLLLNATKLKEKLFAEWDNWCAETITTTEDIALEGEFRKFVEGFDFSIFQYKPTIYVIDEHRKTPYFATRFGGGLPDRPIASKPTKAHASHESRYIEQLLEAYSDHKDEEIQCDNLDDHPKLQGHFNRQREAFYHAESLKLFARDSVPDGTFEDLQEEIFTGVIDVEQDDHEDGYKRVKEVTKESSSLALDSNGLFQVVKLKDRHGICHQLANENRLTWRKDDE